MADHGDGRIPGMRYDHRRGGPVGPQVCLAVFCGTCENCTSGRPNICSNSEVRLPPGAARRLEWEKEAQLHSFMNLSAFAEQMLVHENAITRIDKKMPLDKAAMIGCGVLTGFGAAAKTAGIRPGQTVAIIGCGGVGMAAVNALINGASRLPRQALPIVPSGPANLAVFEHFADCVQGQRVVVIGRYPGLERYAGTCSFTVRERQAVPST